MEQIAKEEQRKAWKMQGMTALNIHSHAHTVALLLLLNPVVGLKIGPKQGFFMFCHDYLKTLLSRSCQKGKNRA